MLGTVTIGNDVVDLADPECRLEGRHPRFAQRVFSRRERDALDACAERHLRHWALWAAKESAYKAAKRLAPDTVFAPSAFEVEIGGLVATGGARDSSGPAFVAAGCVLHRGGALALEVERQGDALHAIVAADLEAGAFSRARNRPVVRAISAFEGDPSVAVRRLAVSLVGPALGLAPEELAVLGRPPIVVHRGRPVPVTVSLSHHGRFVACAFIRPRS